MSLFDPEQKEHRETRYEKNKFSREKEKMLLKALDEGKETFPDIVQCPIQKCGNPLNIQKRADSLVLRCKNCGWESVLRKGKRIMIFTEGTLLMHKGAIGRSRGEAVSQVVAEEASVGQYADYVPVGESVKKIKEWAGKGAVIIYLTSRKGEEVEAIKSVLKQWDFPEGSLEFRKEGEEYKDVIERVIPDVLIEDDCKSIGGAQEMVYPNLRSGLKSNIKSVVVKEFDGIDGLSDCLYDFFKK